MTEKQWMTYSQIAARLGVTPDAIRHRSRKEGWQRQEGNDGKIRVLIDPELLSEIPARNGADSAPDSARNSGHDSDHPDREIRRLEDQSQIPLRLIDLIDHQRTEHQKELARQRVDHAAELERVRADAERLRGELDRDRGDARQEREAATAERARLLDIIEQQGEQVKLLTDQWDDAAAERRRRWWWFWGGRSP